jgi:hypothetical protein
MRHKTRIEIQITTPITDEDRQALEKAIKAVVGILITPESYMIDTFILP